MIAVLRNHKHPECGVASISFPIKREKYDRSIEALSALEIGDAVKRDCFLESIDTACRF